MRSLFAMDDRTQGAMLLAVGGVALRLGLTNAALNYVKAGLQPLLTISGAVLVALGLIAVVRAFRSGETEATHGEELDHAHVDADGHAEALDDGHGHGVHGPQVAWLLMLPLLALLLIAPPPLGAFAASRQTDVAPAVDSTIDYPPLPEPEGGAVPLPLSDFVFRALYDDERSLEGQTVRLTGFVAPSQSGDDYQLTRFTVNCCAADGRAVSVAIADDGEAPEVDTWWEMEGTWVPREGAQPGEEATAPPLLQLERRTAITPPEQPYEY